MKTMRKTRRTAAWIMVLALLCGIFQGSGIRVKAAQVAGGECGTNVTYDLSDDGSGGYVLTISTSNSEDNKMADYGTPTGKTPAPWAEHIADITKLVVEDGVSYLGNRICYGATSLKEISIPKSVTGTGNGVFRGCEALTEGTIPGAVTTMVDNLFYGCTSLKNVTLGEGTTIIGRNMVNGCTALETLTIPGSITTIEGTPFDNTTIKTIVFDGTKEEYQTMVETMSFTDPLKDETIEVTCTDGTYHYAPSGTTDTTTKYTGVTGSVNWELDMETKTMTFSGSGEMADYTRSLGADTPWYAHMQDVETVVIGDGITRIGARIMYGANNLKKVTIGKDVTSTGNGCFRQCPQLEEIVLPNNEITFEDNLCYKDTSLVRAVVGENVTTLGRNMFYGCSALEELTLPGTITDINENALYTLTSLTTINYSNTSEKYQELLNLTYGSPLKNANITVNCTDGEYEWGTSGKIGENVRYSFDEASGILYIKGTGAMDNLTGSNASPWKNYENKIKTVFIEAGITYIGKFAFYYNTNISQVYYMMSSEEWELLKENSGICNEPLWECKNIASAKSGTCGENATWSLNDDNTTLTISGSGAIDDYKTVTLQPWYFNVKTINKIVVGDEITRIGNSAFDGMAAVTEISFGNKIESFGIFALNGCNKLTAIELKEGVKVLGSKSFQGCNKLKSVTLPETLHTMDMKAFNEDALIQDVYYAGTLKQWNKIMISKTQSGNKTLLDATFHFGKESEQVAAIYDDVNQGSANEAAIQYMNENGYMTGHNGKFGVAETMSLEEVAVILYGRAGASAEYNGAMDWAISHGIMAAKDTLTQGTLQDALDKTAKYNGAVGYDAGLSGDEVVTREQGAAILSSYLQNPVATANRTTQITDKIKEVVGKGGDGKLYITAINLEVENSTSKPGDSIFILLPDGKTMMIDYGSTPSKNNIINFLQTTGITKIDYFVLSHPHGDHVGNALSVAQYLYGAGGSIGTYYYTGFNFGTAEPALLAYLQEQNVEIKNNLRAGDILKLGEVSVEIFSPVDADLAVTDTGDESINNTSLAMKFTYGTSSYFTSGDIYTSKEKELVAKYGSRLQADVVKLNHHGCYTSSSKEWIENMRARIVLVEDIDNGSYDNNVDYSQAGAKYYSAGLDNMVMVVMGTNRDYSVITGTDSTLRQNYSADKLALFENVERAESKVNDIGEVTLESKEAITQAVTAYEALSEDEKNIFYSDMYSKLMNAKKDYEALVNAEISPSKEPSTAPTTSPTVSPSNTPVPTTAPSTNPSQDSEVITIEAPETTFTVKGYTYEIISSKEDGDKLNTVSLTGVKDKKTVVIPSTVKIKNVTYRVVSIGKKALMKNKKMSNLVIGKYVKNIGEYACYQCTKLSKITIKTKVLKNVGKKAFSKIKKKAVIKYPKGKAESYRKLFA